MVKRSACPNRRRDLTVFPAEDVETKVGCLYVCPTPIGNLEDVTLRVLRVFRQVDLILAEDTRHTRILLNHYEITTSCVSYHAHSTETKEEEIVTRLKRGEKLALASDAGTPGISDPGERLVRRCVAEGLAVVSLPGPTAAIAALVASGLPTAHFVFLGFLPRKSGPRCRIFTQFGADPKTLVLYESPHRVRACLEDVRAVLGERQVAVVRELSKKFEEIIRGRVSEVLGSLGEGLRGEVTLIIGGGGEKNPPSLGTG